MTRGHDLIVEEAFSIANAESFEREGRSKRRKRIGYVLVHNLGDNSLGVRFIGMVTYATVLSLGRIYKDYNGWNEC